VRLEHGWITGRRKLFVDGELKLDSGNNLVDFGGGFRHVLEGHVLVCTTRPYNFVYRHLLLVDGVIQGAFDEARRDKHLRVLGPIVVGDAEYRTHTPWEGCPFRICQTDRVVFTAGLDDVLGYEILWMEGDPDALSGLLRELLASVEPPDVTQPFELGGRMVGLLSREDPESQAAAQALKCGLVDLVPVERVG
ncbi:MAG: hypothetical protein H6737_30420, partial [Alphaproteobacteria bacterium]|nr:hypothetical protein [Alphaproteobacteria bacterium]